MVLYCFQFRLVIFAILQEVATREERWFYGFNDSEQLTEGDLDARTLMHVGTTEGTTFRRLTEIHCSPT